MYLNLKFLDIFRQKMSILNIDSCRTKMLTDLPSLVMVKILNYFTYEELSHLRLTCKFIQKHTERMLNEGFFLFGRRVAHLSTILKRQLPKKESERRAHPLNRYCEVYSALETRYTLMTMTYRKYMDQQLCCFIPGKVLDIAFDVMRQINGYLAAGVSSKTGLDIITILRDIRDYSSMAMEHFDEHVAPRFPVRPLIPMLKSNVNSLHYFSQLCTRPPNIVQNFDASNAAPNQAGDFEQMCASMRNEMRSKFDEQNRVIDEQRRIIGEQGEFISQIVVFLSEMGKKNEWAPHLMNDLRRLSSNCGRVSVMNDNDQPGTSTSMGKLSDLPTLVNESKKRLVKTRNGKRKCDMEGDGIPPEKLAEGTRKYDCSKKNQFWLNFGFFFFVAYDNNCHGIPFAVGRYKTNQYFDEISANVDNVLKAKNLIKHALFYK